MDVNFFGIRHHGPGSAKSLLQAFKNVQPDMILVEGPPEGQSILKAVASKELVPPVAMLIYDSGCPSHAVFYPFTNFSPEWQAIQYSLKKEIPLRWIDLPWRNRFTPNTSPTSFTLEKSNRKPVQGNTESSPTSTESNNEDYMDVFAKIAGYENGEEWWESLIERTHQNHQSIFLAIAEMMRAIRQKQGEVQQEENKLNDVSSEMLDKITENDFREAYMRKEIRQAIREKYQKIAVVCGAWHVPALEEYLKKGQEEQDTKILELRPAQPSSLLATWVPWSNSRLSYRSGYGAGIYSPGWYQHLWQHNDKAPIRWIIQAARLLRKEDLDASSASVIESVRLAEMLAIMRGIVCPGLKELTQAIQAVLCKGESTPLALIRQRLEIGDDIGKIPSDTPLIPLQKDLESWQTGKLKISAIENDIELDLRKTTDLNYSLVLRRLNILGIPWGKLNRGSQKGTAREFWRLKWDVTFIVSIIEKSIWGTTIEEASNNFMCHQAHSSENLKELAEYLNDCIASQLNQASDVLLEAIQEKSALATEITSLMQALPSLTELARYGDVRRSNQDLILHLIRGIFERILIGIPNACASLDNESVISMLENFKYVQNSLNILNQSDMTESWQALLRKMVGLDHIHPLLRGWATRILFEKQVIQSEEFHTITRLSLSLAYPPEKSGAWLLGVLEGTATWLIHQENFWITLNAWLIEIPEDIFVKLLPLLRRAFSNFTFPERRLMAEKIKNISPLQHSQTKSSIPVVWDIDSQRAKQTLQTISYLLLGVPKNGSKA